MNLQQQAFLCGYFDKQAYHPVDWEYAPKAFNYKKFFDNIPEVKLPEGMRTPEGQQTTPEMKLKQDMYLRHMGFPTPNIMTVKTPIPMQQRPAVRQQQPMPAQIDVTPEETQQSTSWGDTILDWLRSQLVNQY